MNFIDPGLVAARPYFLQALCSVPVLWAVRLLLGGALAFALVLYFLYARR